MTSKVYFTDMHTELNDGLLSKLKRLLEKSGLGDIDMEGFQDLSFDDGSMF